MQDTSLSPELVKQDTSNESFMYLQADDFRKFVEMEVLKIIKLLADGGETPQERIQQIARNSLTLLIPGLKIDELYRNAIKLDDDCPELAPVVVKLMREYEDKYEHKAIGEVSHLIRQGQYDEANEMVKKVLMFKVLQ